MTAADLITAAPGRWTVPLLCRRLRREPADVERELASIPRLVRGWRGELSIPPEPAEAKHAEQYILAAQAKREQARRKYAATIRAAGLSGATVPTGDLARVFRCRADYVRTIAEIVGAERCRDAHDSRAALWRLP